jgi:hypothetical protein
MHLIIALIDTPIVMCVLALGLLLFGAENSRCLHEARAKRKRNFLWDRTTQTISGNNEVRRSRLAAQ